MPDPAMPGHASPGPASPDGNRAQAPGPRASRPPHEARGPLAAAYAGKRVLLIGATGFLGGVTLSMLLARCPEICRVYVLMRRSPGLPAAERFRDRVLPSAAFDPVRERWDDLGDRVTVLQGDLSQSWLGLDEAVLAELAGQSGVDGAGSRGGLGGAGSEGLDLILNCAGLVEFEAPLDQAYRTNILGVRNLLDVARRTGAHLVHVSTCFVAGSAAGVRPETVAPGFFPRQAEAPYLEFDPEREVRDLEAELERVSAGVDEQAAMASYREQALERFKAQNAGLPPASALANAARRLQRDDLKARLVEAGRRRASFWGWPNVYTYSKSIGEQLIAASEGVRWSIARPAIIESALRFPEPGYNLNATTSAPLVMLALNGFQLAPARPDLVIDIVPVDAVASGVLAIGAAGIGASGGRAASGRVEASGRGGASGRGDGARAPAPEDSAVYQIGTSDVNPCRIDRVIELIGLYLHEREMAKKPRLLEGVIKANREPGLVDRKGFENRTRQIESLWRGLAGVAGDLRGRVDDPRLRDVLERVGERASRTAEDLDKARTLWELFLPFSHDHDYRFKSDAVRRLWDALGEPQDLESLDWRSYWIDVHIPGLRKHVLTDSFGKPVKPVAIQVSLAERIEAVARTDPYRAALTTSGGHGAASGAAGSVTTLTYAELWSRAGALAEALREQGLEEVGIPVDTSGAWIAGLVAAQRAGVPAVLAQGEVPVKVPVLALHGDVYELKIGRRKVRGEFPAGRPAVAAIGPSELPPAPAVRWAGDDPVSARDLARTLAEVGDWLGLEPGDTVAVADVAAPALLLAPLHAQAEVWIAAGDALPAILAGGGATRAVVAASVPAEPGRVRSVLDLTPSEGGERLEPFTARRIPVIPVRAEGLAASKLADRQAQGGGATVLHPEAAEDSGERGERPGYASLGALLADDPAVESWVAESPRQVFIRPNLSRFRDFRTVITHMQRLLRDLGARVPAADRPQAIVLTLGSLPDPAAPDTWEARTDWIRITPKSSRADWSEYPDDRIPLEDLEEDTVRLLRGWLDARSLDFVLEHHREGPATYDRLLLLERVLLAMYCNATPVGDARAFNAQAFLQRHADEAARTGRLEYKIGFKVGTLVQKWRNWHDTEDPESPLLPRAVTEPVKKGLGLATNAFFDLAMDVGVRGEAYIPAQGSFLVVANHSSHLDTGVIKYALGAWGERIRALAAKDYFFGSSSRRFLAHHFTRLIPTDRQAVTTEWIKRAREALAEGDCVLIFPEGTRTSDPSVGAFKASLGTLLRACRAPVLPVYIHGTHDILPKGAVLPHGRKIRVHIGPPIPYSVLEDRTADSAGTLARDREMADLVRRAVAGLERGDFFWLEGGRPGGLGPEATRPGGARPGGALPGEGK